MFNPDSKLMYYGTKFAHLMILQLLTFMCCIPVVTAGAAFTAMHKVLLQIYRNEDTYISRAFFRSFAQNFAHATIIWMGYLLVLVTIVLNWYLGIVKPDVMPTFIRYLLPVTLIVTLISVNWVFVLLSRYNNTLLGTVRMGFVAAFAHPLYTIANTVLMVAPFVLLMFSWDVVPYFIMLGFTLPGIVRAVIYSKVFDKLEDTNWRKAQAEEDA